MARSTARSRLTVPAGPQTVTLPHRFSPRSYEREVFIAREQGCRRFLDVIHRRGGKSKTYLNLGIRDMASLPFAITVLHVCPSLVHGRRNIWDAKSSPSEGGMPFRAHFPPGLVMESSETEMQLILRPLPHQQPQAIPDGHGGMKQVGSIYQILGTENEESVQKIRGHNAYGWIFDEYQLQDPRVWTEIAMPVVMENGGWAAFIGTPAGKNHFFRAYQHAQAHPWPGAGTYGWLSHCLSIRDTKRDAEGEDGSPVIGPEEEREIQADPLMTAEIWEQEYLCSWHGFARNTIYGEALAAARREGRIGPGVRDAGQPVGACLDIGRSDGTAVWFYQTRGAEVALVDYFACRGKAADYVFAAMQRKPYLYGAIILPGDTAAKPQAETFAKSTYELAETLWPGLVHVNDLGGRKPTVQSGIGLVRSLFPRFSFNEAACDAPQEDRMPSGLESLTEYRREWNTERMDYSGDPIHNVYSHGADALREGAKYGFPPLQFPGQRWAKELTVELDFDPREPVGSFRP